MTTPQDKTAKLAAQLKRCEEAAKEIMRRRDSNELRWLKIRDKIMSLGLADEIQKINHPNGSADGYYTYGDLIS